MAQDNTNTNNNPGSSSSPSLSASAALALSAVRSIHQQPPQSQPSTRRVPPPCWTHEETSALIESYHEKWYSLRRGNLKATHWQEVADAVAQRCPFANPSKTSVQCRHKIEKLRKRYRTEKQRSLTVPPPHRFNSSWVFFNKMDNMEKGPSSIPVPTPIHSYDQNAPHHADDDVYENEDDEEDEEDDQPHQYYHRPNTTSNGGGSGSGFRYRIPSGPRSVPVFAKNFSTRGEENPNTNPSFGSNPRFWGGNSASKSGFGGKSGGGGGGKRELDPLGEMVSSIRMLGEGFVKMEQMKMEMAREMEQMRMEMEMKRTEMIIDSQQRIVEAFAKEFSAKKKLKRMPPSSESQRVVR